MTNSRVVEMPAACCQPVQRGGQRWRAGATGWGGERAYPTRRCAGRARIPSRRRRPSCCV